MLLTHLFEARQQTAMQTLARYLVRPDMFVSFVDIEKLGINPRTTHTSTPLGIYAYPLQEAFEMMEEKRIRFAGDRKYICLFEGQGNLLDLQTYTHEDYEAAVERIMDRQWRLLSKDNEDFAANMLSHWESEMWDYDHRPGMALWRLVGRLAGRAGRLYNREEMVISNSVFRKLGYDGVVDHGGSIIHVHEPAQAVFFSRDVCRVSEFLINDHLPGHNPAFAPRGEKKVRGFKPAVDDEGYPITDDQ